MCGCICVCVCVRACVCVCACMRIRIRTYMHVSNCGSVCAGIHLLQLLVVRFMWL